MLADPDALTEEVGLGDGESVAEAVPVREAVTDRVGTVVTLGLAVGSGVSVADRLILAVRDTLTLGVPDDVAAGQLLNLHVVAEPPDQRTEVVHEPVHPFRAEQPERLGSFVQVPGLQEEPSRQQNLQVG